MYETNYVCNFKQNLTELTGTGNVLWGKRWTSYGW